jgi:ADP-dependent phosphofructokinase/glucokinase
MTFIACGLTGNVDAVGHLSSEHLEQLTYYCGEKLTEIKAPQAFLESWTDLRDAIVWNIIHGTGAEYVVTNPQVLTELNTLLDWEWAVGGTGLQAACAATTCGHSALVNLPMWSERFQFLVQKEGLEPIFGKESPPPIHYILEYDESICLGSNYHTIKKPGSNRIILRGPDEFKEGLIAPNFIDRLKTLKTNVHWWLLSGYNAVETNQHLESLLDETIVLLESFGQNCPPVHLELASIYSIEAQNRIISKLNAHVQSIGLNEDELADLMGLKEGLLALSDDQIIETLLKAYQSFHVPVLILHTRQFAAVVTEHNSLAWERALQNGIELAAAKAFTGRFCSAEEIAEVVSRLPFHTRGLQLLKSVGDHDMIRIVPALEAPAATTVGLGDTFTAGLLVEAPVFIK